MNEVICNIFGVVHMFKLEYVVCLELLEMDATELPGAHVFHHAVRRGKVAAGALIAQRTTKPLV